MSEIPKSFGRFETANQTGFLIIGPPEFQASVAQYLVGKPNTDVRIASTPNEAAEVLAGYLSCKLLIAQSEIVADVMRAIPDPEPVKLLVLEPSFRFENTAQAVDNVLGHNGNA